jgi:AcrR family transcriptional regulator
MSNLKQVSINRHQKRKQRTRTRIMQSAIDLFMEHGYDNVTLSAIAEEADVGRATFYLHFDDKIDMCIAIINQNTQHIINMAGENNKDLSMRERSYYSWLEMFTVVQTQMPYYFALMGKDMLAILQRNREYTVAQYLSNLEQGLYDIELDLPHEFVANFLAGAVQQVIGWWIAAEFKHAPQEMAEMMYNIIYRESPPFLTDTTHDDK